MRHLVTYTFYQKYYIQRATRISGTVVNSLIVTRLDCCNSLLAGCTKQTLDKLQRVLNCSVRVIFGGNSRHHVTPLLCDHLHWLRARERISSKLCLLVYSAIYGLAPWYLNDVHSSFHCSQPFFPPFRCSWWFARTQNKATTRQLGILCGWSNRLEQSTTEHLFGTYIYKRSKTCSRHICSHVPKSPTVSRVGAANIVRCPCSDSIITMLLRLINCRFIIIIIIDLQGSRSIMLHAPVSYCWYVMALSAEI